MTQKFMKILAALLALLLVCGTLQAASRRGRDRSRREAERSVPQEQRILDSSKMTTDRFNRERRKVPIFKGAFKVGLAIVDFPDTREATDPQAIVEAVTRDVEEYFRRYTFGQCWPEFVLGGVYRESEPLGTYVLRDSYWNPIGATEQPYEAVADLRKRAYRAMNSAFAKCPVKALVIVTDRADKERLERIRSYSDAFKVYERKASAASDAVVYEGYTEAQSIDPLQDRYNPRAMIRWGDPLWPNSSVLLWSGDSSTTIHELGHVLGAPDFYHAPPPKDGVPGWPVCTGGPTGPLYCRYLYCGLADETAYPTIRADTEITLASRWSETPDRTLGVFIPTAHPHYLLCLEYEPRGANVEGGDASEGSIGRYDAPGEAPGGVLVYYHNVTMQSPYLGHPDLAYTYRYGDPLMHGERGNFRLFREGEAFDEESDPANILPNGLPTGVTLTFGPQTQEGARVKISVPKRRLSGPAYRQSLLPVVSLDSVDGLLPTSLEAAMTVRFRGEPLLEEYGFVAGPRPKPTLGARGTVSWPLYHRDRYTARLLGFPPGAKVYVRAYGRSALGVGYSKEELCVTLPRQAESVAPLLASMKNTLTESNRAASPSGGRTYREGYRVGDSAVLTMLRLMSYLRAMPDGTPTKKLDFEPARSIVTPKHRSAIAPHRMTDFYAARRHLANLVKKVGLTDNVFAEDFDSKFAKAFGLNPVKVGRTPADIVTVEEGSAGEQAERVRKSLVAGYPVLLVRQCRPISMFHPALNSSLIDGIRLNEAGKTEVHVDFCEGYDIATTLHERRPSGWWPIEYVASGCDAVRMIFFDRKFGSARRR